MNISIPELSLVVLIGPSGSGKSTFAARHFSPTEIISSDFCRGLVSDDENDQSVTPDAFEVLRFIAAKRLANAKLTVVDATNVQADARKPLLELAREYHFFPVAIVLNIPEKECWQRNRARPERDFGRHVIRNHCRQLRRSLKRLKREGFRYVFQLDSTEEVQTVRIERRPLWNNLRHETGPFDVIGDIHGCCDELEELLEKLGYERWTSDSGAAPIYHHPQSRKVIFLGDLVDRGPRILDTYRLVRRMVEAGEAFCVPGNHDMKLVRKLQGRNVQITHGLDRSLSEIDALPEETRDQTTREMVEFFKSLISHYVLDEGRLVVAHAGMKENMQGRGSAKVRDFALYGETTGETDDFGLPVRHDWAAEYRGKALVVYGHTAVPEPQHLNRTVNLDTGCVYPVKPFLAEGESAAPFTAQQEHDDLLRIEDVTGKRIVATGLRGNVTIREENSIAALEVMSRFAVDPRWLIYLPPTMSPSETSQEADLLEHPAEAFAYYRSRGVPEVICEEKHMGSRAVVIVCRDVETAQRRFGVIKERRGVCYTRTGRPFFKDRNLEGRFLERVGSAVKASGWWEQFETDWVCMDCELMPWSAKAQELLQQQYAAVGASARAGLSEAISVLEKGAERIPDLLPLFAHYRERKEWIDRYTKAYGHYCWPVNDIEDLKLAPFHLLATEGTVHIDRDHAWHMDTLAQLCKQDEILMLATPYRLVDLTDPGSCEVGIRWWSEMTGAGGEGMVVKPRQFVARDKRGLLQPAIKCRGREYLRIIYGPEYTAPEHLQRLRSRGLSRKRSLALREFALGIEALQRFVRREPLYRVHECVFGVLALESEPVDPRL
ncbi:MAG: polynucleotide kinase-phosphatase [Anaerolineales bacterium]